MSTYVAKILHIAVNGFLPITFINITCYYLETTSGLLSIAIINVNNMIDRK